MNLSSEKDRGIHCIRQSVAEFVQHVSAKKNVYRWIIIDDADTLPIISQQALRRPMETHAHTTRFFFVSRYPSDLIAPLKSRCLHVEIEPISLLEYTNYSLVKNKATFTLNNDALSLLLILSQTCSQIETYIKILSTYYKDKTELNYEDINSLFSSPSYNINANIVNQYIKQDYNELLKLFFKIWSTGISYEDFLYELNNYIKQIGILNPQKCQKLYYLIMKGWIQFAQNKTHSFDMLRLMLNN
jgi:DNA polymerase III delta prime subunit